jgi:hypothetical protein
MMQILFTLCLIGAPEICKERRLAFVPPVPVACIFAAGPELAAATPDGWEVRAWACIPPPEITAPAPAR